MMNIFSGGPNVDIPLVLANRDRRVSVQWQLAKEYPQQVVIGAKLNIPGPIKTSPAIRQYFEQEICLFKAQVAQQFPIQMVHDWGQAATGPEEILLVAGPAKQVKSLAIVFESRRPDRRLFDLDVHFKQGDDVVDLSRTRLGAPARQCLLCARNAKDCSRSRRHTVTELQNYISQLLAARLFNKS